jgi:D-glycero-beta-D-manno-heptose 1-phosphate adenylyltransferase
MISEKIKQKILTQPQLSELVQQWKDKNETIVFTNGCFDLIHPGHIEYLAKAADCGTKLIIAVNTDESVKKLKGHNRPILDEDARTLILAAFSFVDAVVLFSEDTPVNLIETLLPHILVKGKDYKEQEIAGYHAVTSSGGKVKTIELVPGYSTTLLEEKIKKNLGVFQCSLCYFAG